MRWTRSARPRGLADAPPSEPHGNGLGLVHRPVDEAGAQVLARGGFGRDADGLTRGYEGEPVLDAVHRARRCGPGVGWPQVGGGGCP